MGKKVDPAGITQHHAKGFIPLSTMLSCLLRMVLLLQASSSDRAVNIEARAGVNIQI